MNIDERIEALTAKLLMRSQAREEENKRAQALGVSGSALLTTAEQNGENIRALLQIAERRLSHLKTA